MPAISYVNASLEIWGCVVSVIIVLCLAFGRRKMNDCDRLFLWVLGCNTATMFFDLMALLFKWQDGFIPVLIVRSGNFIAFCTGYCLLESFAHYLTEYLGKYTSVTQIPLKITRGICVISLIAVVITQFYPVIYGYDSNGLYYRADGFWISQIAGIMGMALNGWMLFHYNRFISGQERIALWAYIVLPIFAMCIQIHIYGLAILNLVDMISIVIIFLFLQAEQGRIVAEQENKLTQGRVSIMLSQIQPHFLYNSLAVIQDMCHDKAPEAEKATLEFAEFLRGNIDSLQSDNPISFKKELMHTNYYLALTKKRFGDKLNIEYDIKAEDFTMPALTLQPIVENAVKYGVMQKEDGGTVTISSKETEDAYVITVVDDGVGFDPMETKPDGRTHIGISNVKERLKIMSNGTLEISNRQGEGTTATITIPKGDVK